MCKGRILKGIGGFYYIEGEGGTVECRARGVLRKKGIMPMVGDIALYTVHEQGYGSLDSIEERKNSLIRPPVSNIDMMCIVMASAEPEPVLLLIDKITAVCIKNLMEPCIIINKCDIKGGEALRDIYLKAGIRAYLVSAESGDGIAELRKQFAGKITAFCGSSGVGKSSIINALIGSEMFETGEIGRTLRGRHTTRHVELIPACGGYIADTPGFGDLALDRFKMIEKSELDGLFPEFARLKDECRYTGCAHIDDADCAVLKALSNGEISTSRYDSYLSMFAEIKDVKKYK